MRRRDHRGQSLVEFALVLPVFLLILVAVFDLGHVVWANDTLSNAAREAARYAIVHGGSESTACPVGPPASTANIPAADSTCPHPSPSKQSIRDAALAWLRTSGVTGTVDVCYGDVALSAVAACDANADDSLDTDPGNNARGQKVTVVVHSSVSLVMPGFFGIDAIDLSASSTMLVNH